MPLTTFTKSLTLTTDWQPTGITSPNLATGTYIVQVSGFRNGICGLWDEFFSGVMTWYDGGTNSSDTHEIMLHCAGHASNSSHIFLRTRTTPRDTDGKTYLEIKCTMTASTPLDITFKFRRVI